VVDDAQDDGPDVGRLLARRLAEYVDLWESAATKLTTGTYRSEDLVDDWFRWWGKAARDVTAGTALIWGTATTAARPDRPTP
jgi:hypothetical protein